MTVNQANLLGLPLFQFGNFSKVGVAHGISTRQAPRKPLFPEAQPAKPDEWRISTNGNSTPYEVLRLRRAEFLAALNTDHRELLFNLTSPMQKHTNNVVAVGREAYRAEMNWRRSIPDTDALVTNLPGVPLMTVHADCPPILFYDPQERVVATAHSGWRGTVAKIGKETVRVMREKYGCKPQNIIAGVGPSIGACCYQVGEPVLSEVKAAFGENRAKELLIAQADKSYHFDLWAAIRLTLIQSGIEAEAIEMSGICTRCNSDRFFSYRATPQEQRHDYGTFGSLVVLT
jgi:polyphenol oxidase